MKLSTLILLFSLLFIGFEAHAFRYYINSQHHETLISDKDVSAIYSIADKNKDATFKIMVFTPRIKLKGPAMQERYGLVRAINIRKIIMSAGVPLSHIEIIVKRGYKKTNRVFIDVIN